MTDKQWRWTLNPAELVYSEKLLLPSFGIYVSRSDPSAVAFLKEGRATDFLIDSGDAYSVSYLRESSNVSTADQDFADLDPGYLRRILLRILDGEEYERLEEHHTRRTLQGLDPAFLEGRWPRSSEEEIARGSSGVAQVRLTDLRLATDITSADLRRELRLVLPGLPLPLTTEGVAKWKWKTLKNLKDLRELADLNTERARKEKWYEEERVRVMVVSYAAAALLLLVDLDKRRLEEATRDTLVEHVEELFELIRRLVDKLDRSTHELLGLLAGRKGTSGGYPSDPYIRHYTALSLYRMGRPAKEIAWRVGTLSSEQRDSMKKSSSNHEKNKAKVPKNWRSNLRDLIKRGVKIEKERLPRAAEVFARKNEEQVRATAIEAYRHYLEAENWEEAGHYVSSVSIGDDLLTSGIPVAQRDEVYRAFIQLGSCEENGIDPLPLSDVKFLS